MRHTEYTGMGPIGECVNCGEYLLSVLVDCVLVGWIHKPLEDIDGEITPNYCKDKINHKLIGKIKNGEYVYRSAIVAQPIQSGQLTLGI